MKTFGYESRWLGPAALCAIGVGVAMAHLPDSGKTLRCEMTFTNDDTIVESGRTVPMPPLPPSTQTMVYQLKGDRWTALSMNGMDAATLVRQHNAENAAADAKWGIKQIEAPKEPYSFPVRVTEQTYILQDKSEPNDTMFLSVDRLTGDVSGSSSSMVGESTYKVEITGHCTPVAGSIL